MTVFALDVPHSKCDICCPSHLCMMATLSPEATEDIVVSVNPVTVDDAVEIY